MLSRGRLMRGSQGLKATTSPALQSSRYARTLLPACRGYVFNCYMVLCSSVGYQTARQHQDCAHEACHLLTRVTSVG